MHALWGSPRPPHITGILSHMERNLVPHGTESCPTCNGILPSSTRESKKRNDANEHRIYFFLDSSGAPR
jgi:hypothetical protein